MRKFMMYSIITGTVLLTAAFGQDDLTEYQTVVNMPLISTGAALGADVAANVTNVVNNFHPEAICLRISWDDISTGPNLPTSHTSTGDYNFVPLRNALTNIENAGLNVFIRIHLAYQGLPVWARPTGGTFNPDDFMSDNTGNINFHPNGLCFSYANTAHRGILLDHYQAILEDIVWWLGARLPFHPNSYLDHVIVVTPVFSPAEEMEYPIIAAPVPAGDKPRSAGFEEAARDGFRTYLEARYDNDINNLEAAWGAPAGTFTGFNDVALDPRTDAWNWFIPSYCYPAFTDATGPISYNYQYFTGRRDWKLFKQSMLKEFVDAFAERTHARGLRFGLRLGTVDDHLMDTRGYYDFTPLVEHADWVHVATTIEQTGKHEMHADYLRSVCQYWSERRGSAVRFSCETNWPNYAIHERCQHPNHPPHTGIQCTPDLLTREWCAQAETFRTRGSSAHLLMNWTQTVAEPWWVHYLNFRNYFGASGGQSIIERQDLNIRNLLYISESRMAWAAVYGPAHNFFPEEAVTGTPKYIPTVPPPADDIVSYDNPFNNILPPGTLDEHWYTDILVNPLTHRVGRDMLPEADFTHQVYDPNTPVDFLTDYMINQSPTNRASLDYICSYDAIYLPRGARMIYEETLENLLSDHLRKADRSSIPIVNATLYYDNMAGHGRFLETPGRLYFENQRTPEVARLIWRTRPDIWQYWPRANYPVGTFPYSYIDWLVWRGPLEYPDVWTTFANWHDVAYSVWLSRPLDLQYYFENGFHGKNGTAWEGHNFLQWVLEWGAHPDPLIGYPELRKYANWPYSTAAFPPQPSPPPGQAVDLDVYILDESFYENNNVKPRFYIINNDDEALSDFVLKYYFTTENTLTPAIDDYWTPFCDVSLEHISGNEWCAVLDFTGYTLQPSGRVPESDGQIFGLYYTPNWDPWNKANDFSQPSSNSYSLTDKVAVLNSSGELVYGSTP